MAINDEDKNHLNGYSTSFCAAKWTQVTIDLQHGMTHSCHHPLRHKIPESELEKDFHALHDTKFKKKQRKKMLSNSRPKECSYCWKIEDASPSNISDRYIKSFDPWSKPYLNEIANSDWRTNYNPKYLEVFFSNTCNLSCSYCMAHVSSSIEKEMDMFGKYPLSDRVMKRHRTYSAKRPKNENLYRDAFWQWLPEVYQGLHTLRLTGGEPLLDNNLDRLMDYMIQNPHEDLTFAVNTNLSVGDNAIDKFYEKLKLLEEKTKVQVEIYTSLDTYGKHAEFIRAGMNYQRVIHNIERYMTAFPHRTVTIMCCYNLLSIPRFHEFLNDVLILKKKGNLRLDISMLQDPAYLCVKWAGEKYKSKIKSDIDLMKKNGFNQDEINKLKRISMFLDIQNENSFKKEKKNFKLFIDEYSKRKKMSFTDFFPDFFLDNFS